MTLRLICATAAAAWVWILHLLAATPSDELPGRWPPGVANMLHAATHAVLALLLLRAFTDLRPRTGAWPGLRTGCGWTVFAFAAAHGLFEEIVQFSVAGRSCSVGDLLLDMAGAALVLLSPWPRGPARPSALLPLLLTLVCIPLLAFGAASVPELDGLLEQLLTQLTRG